MQHYYKDNEPSSNTANTGAECLVRLIINNMLVARATGRRVRSGRT